MPTLIDRLLGRDTAQKAVVTGNGGTGPGVLAYYNDAPLWSVSRNPRRLMRQAQELYHDDLIIRAAENKVSGKAAGLAWHLEDENDDEVGDESEPNSKAIRDWLEKPQGSLTDRKQVTRRELWKLTHRHNGLCGNAFWFLDQRTLGTGAPLTTLYINPARMYPVADDSGNLLGWRLDADQDGNGGVPLELNEVLQFQLDPPDWGHYGIGLVESAGSAAQLAKAVDRHTSSVYGGGGRLAGLISPKVGATVSPDDWAAAVRDWRNIANDPESAKRLHILRGPVDFVRTAATMQELAVEAVSKMSRDDKLALWGVPESQLPLPTAVGLNSGDTKGYDEAVLMQGAVHDRVTPFWEIIQYQVLDVIAQNGGPKLQLVIEEPKFDDDTPNYDRAQKAGNLPLTNNERRVSIGLDPLPDYDFNGDALGTAIYLPSSLTLMGAGPDENGQLLPPPPDLSETLPVDESMEEPILGDELDILTKAEIDEALDLTQDEIDAELIYDEEDDDWGQAYKAKVPKFIFGKLNKAYQSTASKKDVDAELDAIKKRAIAKFGRAPSDKQIMATYKRNLARKQKAAIAARSKKKTGKRASQRAVDATMKRNVKRDPRLARLMGGTPTKASREFLGLRKSLDTRITPAIQKSVARALREQAREIAGKIRARGEHLAKRSADTSVWWNEKLERARMRKAIEPHLVGIAQTVSSHVETILDKPKKADFGDTVADFVKRRGTERIDGILETTRDSINRLIVDGFTSGLGPAEVAASIETATAFDEARSELIARTESMIAYNEAALSSYGEFGVDKVEAIDGDQDEECAARDGQVFTLEESMDITDHPNGTLDWAPVFGKAEVKVEPDLASILAALVAQKAQPVNVQLIQGEVRHTRTVLDRDEFGRVIGSHEETDEPRKARTVMDRDAAGRVIGSHEEYIGGS